MTMQFSMKQAAGIVRCDPATIWRAAKKHGIGKQYGLQWIFSEADVTRLRSVASSKPGRPRKSSKRAAALLPIASEPNDQPEYTPADLRDYSRSDTDAMLDWCADEIERLTEAIEQAAGKLSCVAIERGCSGVPEIVRVCDEQALGILLAAQEGRVT